MTRQMGLLTLLIGLVIVGLAHAATLRGVHPADASLYSGSAFDCKDGSKTGLPLSKVNDDYCDCADGSDEPGTSACLNGRFFCSNLGHVGLSLFSSRVNDGICDCCDGTDEYDGKAKCQDTCYALGEDSRSSLRQDVEAFKKGLVIRQEYEAQAKTVREEKQKKIDELKATLVQKEEDKQALQAQVDALEAKAKAAEELLAQYKPKEGQEQQQEQPAGKVDDDEYEDDDGDDDDEGDDDDDDDEDEDKIAPSLGEAQGQEEKPKVELLERTDDVIEALEQAEKDIAEYKASLSLNGKERKKKREEEDGEGNDGEAEEGAISSVWRKFKASLPFASSSSSSSSLPTSPLSGELKLTDLKELQKRLRSAQNEIDSAANDIATLEDYFRLDIGEDAFHGIRDQTFELQTNQYTYKFTPFKDVKQQHTRLGDWGKWLDEEHTRMEYNGGERCWNGPDRKTIIALTCGDVNKVVSVQEPNKCEYLMEFITPAACSPERLGLLEQELARLENRGAPVVPLTNDIL